MLRLVFFWSVLAWLNGNSAWASAGAAPVPVVPAAVDSGDDLVVRLVTFGPGDDIASWFGHSALVVENRRTHDARLFNYGEFSFDQTLLLRYALGRLEFWVGERPVESTLQNYRQQGRSVQVQELNLSSERRLEVSRFLRENVRPEKRGFLYDHFTDNCATRPRDIIDVATGGRLRVAGAGAPAEVMSWREHTRRHTIRNPLVFVLLDFVMNSDVDRPITRWQAAFLPGELFQLVAEARTDDGAPLALRTWTDFAPPASAAIPTKAARCESWTLAIGGAFAVLSLLLRRSPRACGGWMAAQGFVVGVPGLVLFLMWTCTDHLVAHNNENILLANPLTLLALPLGLMAARGSQRARTALRFIFALLALGAVIALALKALPWGHQDNWNMLALLFPLAMANAVALHQGRMSADRTHTPGLRPVENVVIWRGRSSR